MGAFAGVLVLDVTHVLAGPFAAFQLGLLGADVIKVENPDDCDQSRHTGACETLNQRDMGANYLAQNANKRSLTLNLKSDKGREILRRLVSRADVLVENYRGEVLTGLGLGPQAMRALNPSLIYCSITGFGQGGPRGSHSAYDHAIQAMSGILAVTGPAGGEGYKSGAPVVDYSTGIMAAFAIASALFHRERTGEGQTIDVSMLDTALLLQASHITNYMATGKAPSPRGNTHNFASQCLYQTREGRIMLAATNRREHTRLFEALGRPDLGSRDYAGRKAAQEEEAAFLTEILLTRTAQEWEDFFQERRVPALKVRGLADTLQDRQLPTRKVLHRFDSLPGVDGAMTIPASAFCFEHDGPSVDRAPPRLGEHTQDILESLGYERAAIEALRAEGVV
jgi:crotonobetainyl-CoA:carnitine CoA-transferase CaiB-like acyl-CoA transferase